MDFANVSIGDVLNLVSNVVAVAAFVAAFTPNQADDAIVAKVRKVVDILAFNFGNAKNQTK